MARERSQRGLRVGKDRAQLCVRGGADGLKCLTLQGSLRLLDRGMRGCSWGRDQEASWEWYNNPGNSEGARPRVGNESSDEVQGSRTQCEGKANATC